MIRWYIYALRDPVTWDVRYIGKTSKSPAFRLRRHILEAPRHRFRNARWLQWLTARGATPLLEVLDAGSGGGAGAAERAWIAEYKRRGADLNNHASGGEGGSGPCSPATRALLSAVQKGRPKPPEQIAKVAAAKTGQRQSAETIAKRVAKNTGQKRAPDVGEKIAATKRGKPRKPETIAAMSAAMKGKVPSAATRQKLADAQKARRERERLARLADPTAFQLPPVSAETRQKLSEAGRGRRHSATSREKMSRVQKKLKSTVRERRAATSPPVQQAAPFERSTSQDSHPPN